MRTLTAAARASKIERVVAADVLRSTMMKLRGLTLLVAAAFALTSAYAGDKACCATNVKNDGKMACSPNYAKLNLTEAQKSKMEALQAECNKGGCTQEKMDKFMKSAEGILSKEQFATLKTECGKMHEGTKA